MGRKRKVQKDIIRGKEDNACSEASTGQEETHLHADHNSNPMDATNIENTVTPYSSPPPNKINSKNTNVVIRRSGRLKNSVSANGTQKIERAAEHVNLVESEKEEAKDDQQVCTYPILSERNTEDEAPQVQQINTLPIMNEGNLENMEEEAPQVQRINTLPVMNEGNLKNMEQEAPQVQKLNTLPVMNEGSLENMEEEAPQIQQLNTLPVMNEGNLENMEEEAPQIQQLNTLPEMNERNLEKKIDYIVQVVDEFKSKTFEQVSRRPNDGPSSDLSYKSLYIDSQKKIEALMEKHYELVKMLEFANGKIDAYEKMHKVMAASKEVMLGLRLEKDAEAISLSPRTVQGFVSAAGAGARDDQNASPSNAADDHTVSPKQKKNNHKRKKAKYLKRG